MNRPRTFKALPINPDPDRRLIEAVIVRAIDDYLFPSKNTPKKARLTASEFLRDEGCHLLVKLGYSPQNVQQVLGYQEAV